MSSAAIEFEYIGAVDQTEILSREAHRSRRRIQRTRARVKSALKAQPSPAIDARKRRQPKGCTRIRRLLHEPETGAVEAYDHRPRRPLADDRPGHLARAHALEIRDAQLGDPVVWACKLTKPKRSTEHPDKELDVALRLRRLQKLEARERDRLKTLIETLEVSEIAPVPDGLPPLTHSVLKRRQLGRQEVLQ